MLLLTGCAGTSGTLAEPSSSDEEPAAFVGEQGGEHEGHGVEETDLERLDMVLYEIAGVAGGPPDGHAAGLEHDANAREHFRERRFAEAAADFVRAAAVFRDLDTASTEHAGSCSNAGVSWYNAQMEPEARRAAASLESEDPICASQIRQPFE